MSARQAARLAAGAGIFCFVGLISGSVAGATGAPCDPSDMVVVVDDQGVEQLACVAVAGPTEDPSGEPSGGGTPDRADNAPASSDLPRTGSNAAGLIIGGSLVAAGVTASLVARRRAPNSNPPA